jgi:formate hydrogenlyase subunit 3/multisubunit Na+/H+ antiporter MnhD subunit
MEYFDSLSAVLLACLVLGAGGLLALLLAPWPRASTAAGVGGTLLAAALALFPTLRALGGATLPALSLGWSVPFGPETAAGDFRLTFHAHLDALAALFLLPLLILGALGAIYGARYWMGHPGRPVAGSAWFFFNLFLAGMILVLVARNAVFFLIAWEVMSIASFFLVTLDDERAEVRRAGWVFLVATHLGAAFLLAMFVILGRQVGSFDFDDFAAFGSQIPHVTASVIFLLALVGFGAKAGFVPLHVWLPEAHPVAPSHVSALMSGVMIKMGIYGLIRTIAFLGTPQEWWAWLLIAVGLASGVIGILFALAQHDLKRLLAYSSVENVGIIGLGLGTGLLGWSNGQRALAVLGFAGALLHVFNHALCKGLLFLTAGCIQQGTHTLALDRLGGLMKRMRWEGTAFLIGALALSALPPLNVFAGEFLIYLSAFKEETVLSGPAAVPSLAVIGGLALIGGLAGACFVKAFGIVFLGEPRTPDAESAHSTAAAMRWPLAVLAAGCVLVGLTATWVVGAMGPVLDAVFAGAVTRSSDTLEQATGPLAGVLLVVSILGVLIVLLTLLRRLLLAGREVGASGTWGCGFVAPTTRLQYTSSSFSQPLGELFQPILRTETHGPTLTDYFPREQELKTETPDVAERSLFRPLFLGVEWIVARLRFLQAGRVQLYVLYIAVTIILLLIWYLGLSA